MTRLGDAIQDELAKRHWTQTDLAAVLGRPLQLVNQLVNGGRGLSPEAAIDLAEAFGNDPMDWARLNIADQLEKPSKVDRGGIARRRAIAEDRVSFKTQRATIKQTAETIAGLAQQIGTAEDRDTLEELTTMLRRHVALLPHRPWRRRTA